MTLPHRGARPGSWASTSTRMVKVWSEGVERFPAERCRAPSPDPAFEVSQQMYYAARLYDVRTVSSSKAREWLWKLAAAASRLLPEDFDVLGAALREYFSAAEKHPGMTLECDGHTDDTRLFALVEEIGEVAACLTYDNDAETGHNSDLESEVIQVIALALAWATRYLEKEAVVMSDWPDSPLIRITSGNLRGVPLHGAIAASAGLAAAGTDFKYQIIRGPGTGHLLRNDCPDSGRILSWEDVTPVPITALRDLLEAWLGSGGDDLRWLRRVEDAMDPVLSCLPRGDAPAMNGGE